MVLPGNGVRMRRWWDGARRHLSQARSTPWFQGVGRGVLIAFGALTGMGALEFVSDVLGRFNTTGIMLALAWQPTVDATGWFLWCWLLLIVGVRIFAYSLPPRTIVRLSVLGLFLPLLVWSAQAATVYHSARALNGHQIAAGLRQSVNNENVGQYLYYVYARTVDDGGTRRNNALMTFALGLSFTNHDEQSLDALKQVDKRYPYNSAYWLMYTGEIIATKNWPYLRGALEDWQKMIVARNQWPQLAECWNTATLFSPVYGRYARRMESGLEATLPPPEAAAIRDVLGEPGYKDAGAFIESTQVLDPLTRVRVLWTASQMEVIRHRWARAYTLGAYAVHLDPSNDRLAADVAFAAIDAGEYRAALSLAERNVGKRTARGNFIASVASLAMGNYRRALAFAATAQHLAVDKEYLEMAISARGMEEVARNRINAAAGRH